VYELGVGSSLRYIGRHDQPKSCPAPNLRLLRRAARNKTKEHVIPKWLIELTGDPKRTWNLGVRFGEKDEAKRERKFAADQFQFPACESCNRAYAALEGRAKIYLAKLITAEALTARQWDDLLDWFDKIRIGLWLGMRLFHQELVLMPPKFRERIGRKDRCLLVYRINPDHEGLIMHGVGDPVFLNWPSCFALTVNGLIFVNVSNDYLLAARIGFPFPRKLVDVKDRTLVSDFDAFYRTKTPLLRFGFYPASIAVYQAILMKSEDVVGEGEDEYAALQDDAFVRDRLIPGSDSRSLIHTSDGMNTGACKPDALIKERELSQDAYRHGVDYLVRFFEYREHMLRDCLESGRGQQAAAYIKTSIEFNRRAIEEMDNERKKAQR